VVPASAPTPPAKKGALQNVVLRKTGRSVVSVRLPVSVLPFVVC
jgi:hypothetical protein